MDSFFPTADVQVVYVCHLDTVGRGGIMLRIFFVGVNAVRVKTDVQSLAVASTSTVPSLSPWSTALT